MKTLITIFLIITIVIISGGIYWFGWRPEQIRKECNIYAREEVEKQLKQFFGTKAYNEAYKMGGEALLAEDIEPIYNSCLRSKGINN